LLKLMVRIIKIPFDPVGLPAMQEDAISLAMKNNKTVNMVVPKEAFGFEFQSSAVPITAVPITDMEGHIVGAWFRDKSGKP